MKFATGPAWAEHLRDALDDHLGHAMEEFEFEADELADIVGDHWAGVLWGCAFKDLLTRDVEPDGRNLVEDYLKRRGWNEAGPNKLYMRALRSSVMSLYEVSEVEPGNGFLVRDLIRGGDPVRVTERSASQTLKAWDKIGARVVTVAGKQLLSGGVLSFTMEAADALMAGLARAEGKRGPRAKLALDDEKLRGLASLVSTAWLFDVVPKAIGTVTPTLHNSDGEEVVFHRVRFPFARGVTQAVVAERLGAVAELHRENDRFWNWLGTRLGAGSGRSAGHLAWGVTNAGRHPRARQPRAERSRADPRGNVRRARAARDRGGRTGAREPGRHAADRDRDDRAGDGRAPRAAGRTGARGRSRDRHPARPRYVRSPVPRHARRVGRHAG